MKTGNIQIPNQAIDVLRIISILAVVLIHTTTRTLEATGLDIQGVSLTLFLNQASRFAVPLFFLLSGFVLELSYTGLHNLKEYLKKRINKIIFPYVFWSSIYYLFVYTQHSHDFISAVFTGSASYQLYFIPSLLIFYAIFPLVHRYYRLIADWRVLGFLGLLQILILANDYYFRPIQMFYPLSVALFNFFPFLLGIIASRHQPEMTAVVEKFKYFLVFSTVFLAGFVFWQGGSRYLDTRNYLSIYSQWRPSILLYTVSLFLISFFCFRRIKFTAVLVNSLSRLSFFVFFVHVIWLEVIWKTIGINSFRQFWFDPLFFGLTASASFLTASILRRVPGLSRLTG